MAFNFPITITANGLQSQSPASLLSQLLTAVAATNPGYTGDLPASLIEDMSSTDVGAIALIDQARVELVNSMTPHGANAFVLSQLGAIYGITPGLATNTSVNVVFTGTVGFVVNVGFQISDGTNVYQIVDGGVIGASGQSASITAIAVNQGSFAVPATTVTQIVTSVPASITLSVTNPTSGTPGGNAETEESYRARVLQAGLASAQGMPSFLKTALQNIPGVVAREVAVIATLGTGIEVICGGGDNYQIANAILNSVFNPSALLGKTSLGTNVTVTLNNYPDIYSILFVTPAAQVVTVALTWNTSLTGFTQSLAVAQIAVQPIADYINAIGVSAPINILELNNSFEMAVSAILDINSIVKLNWTLTVNGSPVSPVVGETIYDSDPEGYWTILNTAITITQG